MHITSDSGASASLGAPPRVKIPPRERPVKVINMSFGNTVSTTLMHDAIRYADAAGVVLVAATGNESDNTLLYPAAYDETIAVGATNENDDLASFSSYGENIDIVAPGKSGLYLLENLLK